MCAPAEFSDLSDKAKLIVYEQLMSIAYFPEKKFVDKQYSGGWIGRVYNVDNDSGSVRMYRDGLFAGYFYSLDTLLGQKIDIWAKLLGANNTIFSTEKEFNDLIISLTANMSTVGISSSESAYISAFDVREKETIHLYSFFLRGFIDGRRMCENLRFDGIKQIKESRKIFRNQSTDQTNSNVPPPPIDAPAIEALLFLKKEFSRKNISDRNAFDKVRQSVYPCRGCPESLPCACPDSLLRQERWPYKTGQGNKL